MQIARQVIGLLATVVLWVGFAFLTVLTLATLRTRYPEWDARLSIHPYTTSVSGSDIMQPENAVWTPVLSRTPTSQRWVVTPTVRPTLMPQPSNTAIPQSLISTSLPVMLCNGRAPSFEVGDTAVVDFNRGSALRILNSAVGGAMQTLAQAYDNDLLSIIDGPICADNIWYWLVIYRIRDEQYTGWASETDARDNPIMCTVDMPECRR